MIKEGSKGGGEAWLIFAAAVVAVIMAAAINWSLNHPYGTSWDEGEYINEALGDHRLLENGKIIKLGGRILKNWGRPPANRVLALPLVTLFGTQTMTMRFVSLLCFALTDWFIFLAARRISSPLAGAFAVLVFSLSPIVVSASLWFGTEGPLYVGTSAMLYYLIASWTDQSERARNWVGLGLAIGLGLGSKVSFVLVGLPALAFWLVREYWPHGGLPSAALKWKAGLLGFLIGAPWYLLNVRSALTYTGIARGFVRNSLGPPSFTTWMLWLSSVIQSLLGYGLSILIGLIAIAWFWKAVIKRESIFDPLQKWSVGLCLCAGLPLVLAQLSGTNHLLRHISPALIPLAIIVGLIADKTGWARLKAPTAVTVILMCGQLLLIVYPSFIPNRQPVDSGLANGWLPWRVMSRRDQWNWEPFYDIAQRCGSESPRIGYLGNGPGLSPPLITFPWAVKDEDIPQVTWLWHYEEGPVDWQKLMDASGENDIVLTAPHYLGQAADKNDLDDRQNAEFADRLLRDPRFQAPIRLQMGRFRPVEVLVFLKKSPVCQEEHAKLTNLLPDFAWLNRH